MGHGANSGWEGVMSRVAAPAKSQETEDQSRARWTWLCCWPLVEQPNPLKALELSQSTRTMLGTGQDDARCHARSRP